MLWRYEVDKVMPNANSPRQYVVQVVSSPRVQDEYIHVKFFTNTHSPWINVSYYIFILISKFSLDKPYVVRGRSKLFHAYL